jgi:hypothetical protein
MKVAHSTALVREMKVAHSAALVREMKVAHSAALVREMKVSSPFCYIGQGNQCLVKPILLQPLVREMKVVAHSAALVREMKVLAHSAAVVREMKYVVKRAYNKLNLN